MKVNSYFFAVAATLLLLSTVDDAQAQFLSDFVGAWTKVMQLDRFEL